MNKIYLAIACLAAMILTGCQQDEFETNSVKEYSVQLLTGMTDREEINITRALPTGYSPTAFTEDPGEIGVFMTQTDATAYSSISGTYKWKDNDNWKSNVTIKYDEAHPSATLNDYYVYGFMPVNSVSASISAITDFSAGATMTLSNVPPTSAQDVCIITGVLNGVKSGDSYKSIDSVDIKEGKYYYQASSDNAMYILFDHIYSKFKMKMRVDSTYNTLRTIKVTKMTMTASAPAMTIDVTYLNNGSKPTVTITPEESSTPIESTILSDTTKLDTALLDLTEFYTANTLSSVTLTTTFDVYDKSGNKLRTGCETSNVIHIRLMEAGKAYIIETVIKPTYLYQLGEEDLDSPTVVVTNS